jgi:predicted unusual protein kinase regulating ubiquinone biosynthesis (AarF/ABC1/UbiB family)
MVLKFNEDKIISNISFYYSYLRLYIYLIYIKFYKFLNLRKKLYNCIYQLCLFGGPIFIKIAQNVANKENIDGDLRNKLLKFQDNNFDYCDKNYDSNYLLEKYNLDTISNKPIFAGSIASVYRCKYKNNDSILKIIHPNIKKKTIMSINLFDKLMNNFSLNQYNINQIVSLNELYNEVLNQIDLNLEYNNLMIIKENFKDFDNFVIIPTVYSHNTDILIESYEDGLKFTNFIETYPERAKEAYYLMSCCFFKMFFDNYVHVDFHESNLRFILKDDKVKIIIYDYGMISHFNNKKVFLSILNVFKKNIFIAEPYKLADLFVTLNKNSKSNVKKFKETIYDYIKEAELDNLDNILNNKMYTNNKNKNLETYSIIKYIVDKAFEFEIVVDDVIFNLLNSFILVEDFNLKIHNRDADSYNSHKERMKYAEENGFINNIKKSFGRIKF